MPVDRCIGKYGLLRICCPTGHYKEFLDLGRICRVCPTTYDVA